MPRYDAKYQSGSVIRLKNKPHGFASIPEIKLGNRGIVRTVIAPERGRIEHRYVIEWLDEPKWPFAKGTIFQESDLELDDSMAQVIYG